MTAPQPACLAEPTDGRVYAARRIVRSTDVTPSGRLRLDALARYLQSAAEDDVVSAGLDESVVWLVRQCQLTVRALPVMGERLSIRTFCSGTGARWAERTTTVHGPGGPRCTPTLAVDEREHDARIWLLDRERLLASARITA